MNKIDPPASNIQSKYGRSLPILIVEANSLNKMQTLSDRMRKLPDNTPPEAKAYLREPFGLLNWLSDSLGITIAIPRTVLREMLCRNDGMRVDIYQEKLNGNHYEYRLNLDTPQHLIRGSVGFSELLRREQDKQRAGRGPGIRIYPSTDHFSEAVDSETPGGFAIISAGWDLNIGPAGISTPPRAGSQAGDRTIAQFALRMGGKAHFNAIFPILSEDWDLRVQADTNPNRNYHGVTLKEFLKTLPLSDPKQQAIRDAFIAHFGFEGKETGSEFQRKATLQKRWADGLGWAQSPPEPERDDAASQLSHCAPGTTISDAASPAPLTPAATIASDAANLPKGNGNGSDWKRRRKKGLNGKPQEGSLTEAEKEKRLQALRDAIKGGQFANGR